MPRDFNNADREKKFERTGIREDSASASGDYAPAYLDQQIKSALQQGCLPCPAAFVIARKLGVKPVAVGDAADRLGVRISNCQLGCFKLEKNLHEDLDAKTVNEKAAAALDSFTDASPLTCLGAFQVARRIGVRPIEIADAANKRHMKIRNCQLGCW